MQDRTIPVRQRRLHAVATAPSPPSLNELLTYTTQLLAQVDELKAEMARLRGPEMRHIPPPSASAEVADLAAYRRVRYFGQSAGLET